MAYSTKLAERIRNKLATYPQVEEKKMFGSLAFMVSGKICVTAGPGRMMIRVDPARNQELMQKPGCQTVMMRGRKYAGYIHIAEDHLSSDEILYDWIELALEYNRRIRGD